MPRPAASKKKLVAAKKAIIRAAKDQPCADCGKRYPDVCLDFDHLIPADKQHNVAHLVYSNHSINTLLREIARCEVCCANCHRIRTHGTD